MCAVSSDRALRRGQSRERIFALNFISELRLVLFELRGFGDRPGEVIQRAPSS